MPKFQIGDEVVRIRQINPSCPLGTVGIVTHVFPDGSLQLSGCKGDYVAETFEINITTLENE